MRNVRERFPKAKLFAEAAHLHLQLEHWMNTQQMKTNDMVDMGMSEATLDKMHRRNEQLRAAWEAAGDCRRAMYDCP